MIRFGVHPKRPKIKWEVPPPPPETTTVYEGLALVQLLMDQGQVQEAAKAMVAYKARKRREAQERVKELLAEKARREANQTEQLQ